MKTTIPLFLTALSFLCLAAAGPKAEAVVPAPDGGYPGANTAEGTSALLSLTTGSYNTAVGWFSLRSNTEGTLNTAVGAGTLLVNVGNPITFEGTQNTAIGAGALLSNTVGGQNTANGVFALFHNTEGGANTATGVSALFSNTIGGSNTASGGSALTGNTTGSNNTACGYIALGANTTGSGNIGLGAFAGNGVSTADHVICVGAPGANVSNSCYIGNIFNQTSPSGTGVFVNADGKLGTSTSSRRFKEEIKPMAKASEVLFALKPVAFHYKKEIDPAGTSQLGLVAEDVEKLNPDLVVRDKEGKPYSVRYDQVNAMLLNEFLKEHRTVQELKKEVAALTAGLQKVTTQLELSKPAPQTALNNQ